MTVPVIEEYLSDVELAGQPTTLDVTLTTDVGTEVGWWLVAVHSWDFREVSRMTAPTGTAPTTDWNLLGYADAGVDAAHIKVWARRVAVAGAQAVTFTGGGDSPTGAFDNHARLYVLSGVRDYGQLRVRASASNEDLAAHPASQTYCPDDDGLLIGVWQTSTPLTGVTNYTMPDGMTPQAEVDGFFSTSRSATQSLSASGSTGVRTATPAAARQFAAVLILVSGPQGAITFPGQPLTFRLEHAFGADLAAHPDDWVWTDNTGHLMPRRGIRGRFGRADWAGDVEPSELSYTLRNVDRDGTNPGRFSSRNPLSPYYGLLRINTPVRVWVDPGEGFAELFSGLVPSWPPYLSRSGADKTIPITAYGFSRLFQQGTPPSHSQFRRAVMATAQESGLLAYWPCEDGERSESAASALPGGARMVSSGDIRWATFDPALSADPNVGTLGPETNFILGTAPLPNFENGGQLVGIAPQGVGTGWSVLFFARSEAETSGGANENIVWVRWSTPDGSTYARWEVRQNQAGTTEIAAYTPAGVRSVIASYGGQFSDFTEYRVEVEDAGANIDVRLYIQGVVRVSASPAAATPGHPLTFWINPDSNSIVDEAGFIVGHLRVYDTATPPTLEPTDTFLGDPDEYGERVWQVYGHSNEAATLRLARLCAEDGVLLDIPPVAVQYVTRMDSQLPGTQIELYRQCAATDGGILYESGFGFAYRPREWRYDPPVALALSFSDVGREDATLQPVDDDREVRNITTVTRESGSSATHEDEAGSSGSAAVSTYQREVRLNIAAAENLTNRAARETRLSTVDGYRYPVVPFSLAARPTLVAAWLDTRLGDGLTITDMPPDAPEDADLIIEGAAYFTDGVQWSVDAACSPAAAWRMWTIEADGNQGRLDGTDVTLADPVDGDDATLVITWPVGDRPPTEDAAQYPVHLEVIDPGYVAGEQVTATAATVTGAQEAELTVTRSVNGAVMSHAAGATVRLWRPSTLAL